MQRRMGRGVRRSSGKTLFGLPLLDIAIGPDPERGEIRGRAHGIIAVGDIARGWIAVGGVARGGIAIGGLAVGLGIVSVGGLAIGGIALGGGAVGLVAIGGAALGYYAFGGAAIGKFVVSAMSRSPEAVEFFRYWFPFLPLE